MKHRLIHYNSVYTAFISYFTVSVFRNFGITDITNAIENTPIVS